MLLIETIISDLQQAWNTADADGWAAKFARDADFVDVLGRTQKGREIIRDEHQKIFDTIYRGSSLRISLLSEEVLQPDLILVHTSSVLHVPAGPRAGDTHAIQTKVVHRDLIRAFHNTIRTDIADFAENDPDLESRSPLNWRGTEQ